MSKLSDGRYGMVFVYLVLEVQPIDRRPHEFYSRSIESAAGYPRKDAKDQAYAICAYAHHYHPMFSIRI